LLIYRLIALQESSPMSGSTIDPRLANARAAPKKGLRLSWDDPVFRSIIWQTVIVGLISAFIWYLAANTQRNLEVRHIATGLGFLSNTAGIPIAETLIPYDPAVNTWGRAVVEGILNTLKVAIVGIVLSTILGTIIGVGRLSKNWLVSKVTAIYVEVMRDVPLLLWLLFWYGMLQALPGPREFRGSTSWIFLTNRGLRLPVLNWEDAHWWALAALVLGLIGTIAWNHSANKKRDENGVKPAVWPAAIGLMIGLPAVVWAALGAPFTIEYPVLTGFNMVGGGIISPEYFALLLGLTLYTAAYIAEIVRSGIEAVPKGQWEAAGALGLRPGAVLKMVVLPQATRVIIPPMTSQFLNLTKNSSLAVAIGFQDVVSISSTMLNQTGQAIEGVGIIMVTFLAFSLSISLFMNWYNARIALVER
jgi:general L-amino acid transport system permease protein